MAADRETLRLHAAALAETARRLRAEEVSDRARGAALGPAVAGPAQGDRAHHRGARQDRTQPSSSRGWTSALLGRAGLMTGAALDTVRFT